MKTVDLEHKKLHGSEKVREPRCDKIMKRNYKMIHEIFVIMTFKWVDGVQGLKLRNISQKLIGRAYEKHILNKIAQESPHSNQYPNKIFFNF